MLRWRQNVVDYSYFFNFEGYIIATQIHWKMLMVVNHMPFLSWISKCSMFVKLYAAMMYQRVYGNFNTHYASNSIFSGATLRDYICLMVRITNRWYIRNHFISNVLKTTKLFIFNTSTVTFFLAVSNLLPSGSGEAQLPPSSQKH